MGAAGHIATQAALAAEDARLIAALAAGPCDHVTLRERVTIRMSRNRVEATLERLRQRGVVLIAAGPRKRQWVYRLASDKTAKGAT